MGISANTNGQVLIEILGAPGCYFCPYAVESAEEVVGNTAIVYWYKDQIGQEYVRNRRRHYNISIYPTTFFNGRDSFIGGGDGVISVTRDFQFAHDRVKDDPRRNDVRIVELNNQIQVTANGVAGTLWFTAIGWEEHKPVFIDTLQIREGVTYYHHEIAQGEKEYIAWVEDRLGTCGVDKYERITTVNHTIMEEEIKIQNNFIQFKGELMVTTIKGEFVGIYDYSPVSMQYLPKGQILVLRSGLHKKVITNL